VMSDNTGGGVIVVDHPLRGPAADEMR